MEPAAFAAQLISRLENLKREQDTISSLEERLQQIQEVCVTLVLTLKDTFVCLFVCGHLWSVCGFLFHPGGGKRGRRR